MLITHDLGVIAEMADYVVVMYAGRIVEKGTAEEIFDAPEPPVYHRPDGLQAGRRQEGRQALFHPRQGVRTRSTCPDYCYFKDRCEMQLDCCKGEYPCEISLSPTHKVSLLPVLTKRTERRVSKRGKGKTDHFQRV